MDLELQGWIWSFRDRSGALGVDLELQGWIWSSRGGSEAPGVDLELQGVWEVICDHLPTEALKCKSLIRKLLFFKRENEGNYFGKIQVLHPRGGSEAPGVDLVLQGWIWSCRDGSGAPGVDLEL